MARKIGAIEQADMLVVELAALLHDIADWKFHDGDEEIGPRIASEMLARYDVSQDIIDHVCLIIRGNGFKGAPITPSSLEGKIVQDADRLDALGAIGIAPDFCLWRSYGASDL